METLRVNYIMYSTMRTGGVRVLLNFANQLAKMGHEVSITTMLHRAGWFQLSPEIRLIKSRSIYDVGRFYLSTRLANIRKTSNLISEIKFLLKLYDLVPKSDINIATFSMTTYVALLKSYQAVPFYHMQHMETIFTDDPARKEAIRNTYFLPMYKVANSTWLRDRVFELTGVKYPILNAAVEHDIFYPRQKRNDKVNEFDVVALGKGGWKNALGIYQAVEKLRKRHSDFKIRLHYFGGSPPAGVPFNNYYNIFHKNISDEELAQLYSDSDVQVTFSLAESFPLPPLEAMACGTAVITTPYGTEDYAFDGQNALIVEPNNVDMLSEKIESLLTDPGLREKIAKNGLITAKKFTYETQAKKLEGYLKETMDTERMRRDELRNLFKKYNITL
jgi:glycosyltransferase involved in cell wall biosynthesis